MKEQTSIRHYTNVDALFSIIQNGFRLSPPSKKWDDQNDYYCLSKLESDGLKPYILCFCDGLGNVHHWSCFGKTNTDIRHTAWGEIKCNIKLNKAKFNQTLQPLKLSLEKVSYCTQYQICEHLKTKLDIGRIKRFEYRIEHEMRILKLCAKQPDNIMISNDRIERITILAAPNENDYKNIKDKLISIGIPKEKIIYSGVRSSKKWKRAIDKQFYSI